MAPSKQYGSGLQYLPRDALLDDIIHLLKRDGAVAIRGLVSDTDLDQTYDEIKDRMNADREWEGEFFPKETKRVNGLIGASPTYTRTQAMNPLFQSLCTELLTTRSTFWWGDTRKESVSKPYVTAAVAIQIGPGGKAQPLHGDSYVNHRVREEIEEWDDVRDERREISIGLMVAGCKVTKENGGTQIILGSHLWSTSRPTPPDPSLIITPTLEKGDALLIFSSLMHGGGNNTTSDNYRLVYSTFVVRGYLRQEENQFLAIPREVVMTLDRATQQFLGYYISEPACGHVEQMDPIYVLYPEQLGSGGPRDF
ncbi:phytanoyl-CoA dioxygenase [Aspergillus carlsbadensis]|nr:phytanoyl-CoA dioxygenase [Aspergillus carlsbadensis]